jgi:hypothetical protein
MILLTTGCTTFTDTIPSNTPKGFMVAAEILPIAGQSAWIKRYYVDEFGSPTDTPYAALKNVKTSGIFSNSATNNSKMYAKFIVDANKLNLELFEYESEFLVSGISSDYAVIKIKDSAGTTSELKNRAKFSDSNTKRLIISETQDVKTVFGALLNSDSVQFRIEVKNPYVSSSSIYLFSVDARGFGQAYASAFIEGWNQNLQGEGNLLMPLAEYDSSVPDDGYKTFEEADLSETEKTYYREYLLTHGGYDASAFFWSVEREDGVIKQIDTENIYHVNFNFQYLGLAEADKYAKTIPPMMMYYCGDTVVIDKENNRFYGIIENKDTSVFGPWRNIKLTIQLEENKDTIAFLMSFVPHEN